MPVAQILFVKIIPLYFIILTGYVAGRWLRVPKEAVSSLLLYILMPSVVLVATAQTPLSPGNLLAPLIFFAIGTALSFLTFAASGALLHDSARNVLAFTAGTGNTGYFGIPVALAVFGPERLGLVVLTGLGAIFFENTFGFYHVARSAHTSRDSLLRMLRLPALHAFILGLILNLTGVDLGETILATAELFRDTYSVLGMMMVGLALSGLNGYAFDLRFISLALLTKFALWPLLVCAVISLDRLSTRLLSPELAEVLLFLSFMPLAANTAVFATELRAQPEKAALAVVASTMLALALIPLVTAWLVAAS
ncbi:MAG: AEC family transporter [Armatimonadetes bacterium]|nr:AEC family transporter [Armatimonadota bacterium]